MTFFEEPPEESSDRPLECSECKKAIGVLYTVVDQTAMTHTVMCEGCPQLEKRLFGRRASEVDASGAKSHVEGLACKSCGTSVAHVRSGALLGCSQCYETFSDVLISEMVLSKKVPQHITKLKSGASIHSDRAPGESAELSPGLRLHALNEALSETLQREDYEQAAWIRDQIKKLTEKGDGGQ